MRWLEAMEDPQTLQRLVEIARMHCKLVLEHGRGSTRPKRREAIKNEIEQLRVERNNLLHIR